MTSQTMLEIGNRAGVFTLYRWTKEWWQITFPDGSYEIVSGENRTQLEDSIIKSAFSLWGQRALVRMIKTQTNFEGEENAQ